MGICLDTEQQDGSQVLEEAGAQNAERWRKEAGILATPPGGNFPMQNSGTVKFEPPTVPVIFVLGGPGSGKVTHCDTLTQEKKGIVHINMTDLLQQYALGNDMQDFGLLSSKTVTEVLMLEIKMSPGAKTFLVSGYPRNMRDVVEYSEKIQIVNGVILVAWKQEILERQIDYGAQLGQLIIELARMELQNFYKNVMPVAEYFDQSEMLLVVNGERNPSEVYVDFRESVMRILGLSEEVGSPKREVSSSMEAEVEVERGQDGETSPVPRDERLSAPNNAAPPQTVASDEILPTRTHDVPRKGLPPIVWVIGGPGSNKAMVCAQAVRKMSNWVHLSVGSLLVTFAASNSKVHEALVAGELVPSEIVMQLLEQQILLNRDCNGVVIDGFPRDLKQARDFENKFGQRPDMLLLDTSKLQPGRGRLYDGMEAFERRLELFRELALPMLKSLDARGRLIVVEGNTELPADRQQFASALLELMRRAARNEDDPNRISVLNSEAEEDEEESAPPKPTANGVAKPIGNGVAHRANDDVVMGNGVADGRRLVPQPNGSIPSKTTTRKVPASNRLQNVSQQQQKLQQTQQQQRQQTQQQQRQQPQRQERQQAQQQRQQPQQQRQQPQQQRQQPQQQRQQPQQQRQQPQQQRQPPQQQRQPPQQHQSQQSQPNSSQSRGKATGSSKRVPGQPNGVHLLQNGVAQISNGFLPNNRVAPTRQNGTDTLRRMYTEVEDSYNYPPTNLHI